MSSRSRNFDFLPVEIHWEISQHLDLPSALALLKTSRHYSQLLSGHRLYQTASYHFKEYPNCRQYQYIIDNDLDQPLRRILACGLPIVIRYGECVETLPARPDGAVPE